jgi:hypothetical protein
MEMQHWMDISLDCGYLRPSDYELFIERLEEINRLLHGMINKAHMFCTDTPSKLHEVTEEYFTP